MKKILSLGVASAVLAMTAVAASADIVPVIVGDATVGNTITVEITAKDVAAKAIEATQFQVVWSENLTLVDSKTIDKGYPMFNAENGKFGWMDTASTIADDAVLLTLTFSSTAAAGEEISVSLKADPGFADISEIAATAPVVEAAVEEPTTEDVTDPTSEDVTSEDVSSEEPTSEDVSSEEPTVEEPTVEEPTVETPDDGKGENPDTGVALAVVPAVLAAAAAIVAKKRK